jgi:DHA1 family bicyclomycin/chloramphenicol resistance-like MFS transporter
LALAPHGKEAGAASAMMGSLQSFIATFAGIAVAIFNDGTVPTLAMLMIGSTLLAALSFLWVGRRRADAASM